MSRLDQHGLPGSLDQHLPRGRFESLDFGVAEISSDYTTDGENTIEVDTSGGAVTVTIKSDDIPAAGKPAKPLTLINTGTNDLTVTGEGSETISPDGVTSLTFSADEVFVELRLVAGTIYVDRKKSLAALSTEDLTVNNDADLNTQEANDVLGARSSGTWETNNTGTTLLVTVEATTTNSGERVLIVMHHNSSQSNNVVWRTDIVTGQPGSDVSGIMYVPPGYDYKVEVGGNSNASFSRWSEQEFGTAPA